MNNLVEQFDVIEQRFTDLVTEYPQELMTERLEDIKKRVGGFQQDAVQQLSNMLREQRLVEPVAGPRNRRHPRRAKSSKPVTRARWSASPGAVPTARTAIWSTCARR